MKVRAIGLMSFFTTMAFAQYAPPKFEVFGAYSYLQFNPSLSGLQSRSFNGGGGGAQFNFGRYFGIKGEFFGYGSNTWTVVNTAPIVTSKGIIPTGVYSSSGDMFTYLFDRWSESMPGDSMYLESYYSVDPTRTGTRTCQTQLLQMGAQFPRVGRSIPLNGPRRRS